MDTGNEGCAHVRAMVPCMGLGITCPEEVADSLSTNKNPRARKKKREEKMPMNIALGLPVVSRWEV